MNIILDTNIFREDFPMKSSKFLVLFDYLRKTNSKIIVPQIVYQEIAALHEREICDKLQAFNRAKSTLDQALLNVPSPAFNIVVSDQAEKYLLFFKQKLKISD